MSSGPDLCGLFRAEPRTREVVEGGEGHRFQVKASREYLHRSVRTPADQLAVAESGATKGQPYLPVMPPFAKDVLSDAQIDAIGDYLATLNAAGRPWPGGRSSRGSSPKSPTTRMKDGLQWLVGDTVRLQRGPLPGASGRSIHVGNPNGVNYTFDPRLLAIVKIWQGGFLDMAGELTNRGNQRTGARLRKPRDRFRRPRVPARAAECRGRARGLHLQGRRSSATPATFKAALYNKEDQLALIAAADAQFLGYSRNSKDKTAAPAFKYRVGKNVVEVATTISDRGAVAIRVSGKLGAAQSFALNSALLKGAHGQRRHAGR